MLGMYRWRYIRAHTRSLTLRRANTRPLLAGGVPFRPLRRRCV